VNNFRPDSYCGLYCGACDILNCYRASLETGGPPAWEDLPQRFRDHIHRAEVICQGCKTDVLFDGCKRCSIRICAKEKHIQACNECAEYPCQEVTRRTSYIAETMKEILPHTKVMFRNIDSIKEMGIAHWIEDQEQKWSCPQCGAPFTWYQETCSTCGMELEPVKDYNHY